MFRFPKRVVFWQFHRGRDGSLPMFESHSLAPYDADPSLDFAYTGVAEQLNIEEGHRLVDGVIALTKPDGGVDRFRIERLSYPIYMQGGGYWNGFDDGLGRGVYRGDAHGEGEVWDVSHPTRIIDPKGVLRPRPDAYAELWGRATNLDDPTETGDGHLECVVAA